ATIVAAVTLPPIATPPQSARTPEAAPESCWGEIRRRTPTKGRRDHDKPAPPRARKWPPSGQSRFRCLPGAGAEAARAGPCRVPVASLTPLPHGGVAEHTKQLGRISVPRASGAVCL